MIGDLTNDPLHDRYSTSQIRTQLNTVQNHWNVTAGIIVDTVTITTVDGTRAYNFSDLTGTPIEFRRVTHKGIELLKRSKNYFDLYTNTDWSLDEGTPRMWYVDTDAGGFTLVVYPTPQDADAGANLVVEYIKAHTAMASDSDSPFDSLTLLTPYHHGVAYEASANLLAQDPSDQQNIMKLDQYRKIARSTLDDVIQVFKAMDKDEPMRITGGRNWRN